MASADQVRGTRERDKLTIAEVCADLGISRRTFYEWRAKGRAPRCITLPNGSLRVRRSEYQRWLAAHEWNVPASVDTRLSCPIRRESEKWVRHAAHIRRSTRRSR